MEIAILLGIGLCLVVLVGLFVLSFKMLRKVQKEERTENVGKVPMRQLHPKLQAEQDRAKQEQAKPDKK
ncbi:hypothetical protein [Acinetobacter sp. RF14B]|uniref:hypothetical protein n=1 Tax=Acinetobacter sp. RF14B TaxID=2650965 RepID=UPI001168595C|nr:hypothetical protein [Acinetobacter sp. RF14B]TQR72104.1 hypothetical protein E2K52_01835 [Acinetobacter sp. RF14B]